ncbi:hypothetical protein BW31_01442 [Pantoea agglomerans]|uniref:hypothetical protein n=1 Tax=Enterobacter agglomerans TaxID=549 RepID=UPI00044955D7|nr:hypothetical protein [Pantoea agglomerans]EZI34399.1 hypothetical protein BW31_01442 [Pantoea agglomerans]
MENEFEKQTYDAACMAMGAAVWQLMLRAEKLTPDAIARKIIMFSERRDDLAASIALSVLLGP